MSNNPAGRSYSLSAEQHQYLNRRAVAFTQELNRPVSCRQILDALLMLGQISDIGDEQLLQQLKRRFNISQ